jgi:cytochrome c oxidase assembly protein subunit 15
MLDPWYLNPLYNMATVQFNHRVLALVIAVTALTLVWRVLRDPRARRRERAWSWALLAAIAVQLTLGISTLLLRVPVPLAALHQAGAVALFTCTLGLFHSLTRESRLHT